MIDATLIFDGTLPATGAALTVTRASTNVLDTLSAHELVNGEPDIELHVKVTTAFTAGGAATLQIAFQGSADNATFHDLLLSPIIPVASMVVGARIFRYKWPYDQQLNAAVLPDRYYRLNYTVATGPFTAGALMAYAAADRDDLVIYPRNFSVGA